MRKIILLCSFIINIPFATAQDLGDPSCDSLLLVSSWSRDNVKIYDGCDGSYIQDLAAAGVLDGPQAIFQDANGDVIVVSESNHKLVKFDLATLSQATVVVEPGLMNNPITVVKKDNNTIYLGSYSSNQIIELNTQTWQAGNTILPANNGQIQGIDIGMALGPDGQLYVPGYDSDSILKVDPTNSNTQQFVTSGADGLDRPRSILFQADSLLVTAWGNQAIARYDLNGNLLALPVTGLIGAAGMVQDGENHILVTSDSLNTVRRYNTQDFSFETLVPDRSGGLVGATFVYRLNKIRPTIDITGVQQAWVTGVGQINDNEILVNAYITQGGVFGDAFNPDEVTTVSWGEVLIAFNGCHTATMNYTSDVAINGDAFNSGGYAVERLAMNQGGLLCEQNGYTPQTDRSFMAGTFFGGAVRDGEGFTIDFLNQDQAVVTWFTYLPAASTPPAM